MNKSRLFLDNKEINKMYKVIINQPLSEIPHFQIFK